MSRMLRIKCYRCGLLWEEDLDELDEACIVFYREGDTIRRRYHVVCERCGAANVVEEEGDG
jgi:NMD protein affecting ribosome stability and mRNA decay